MTSPDDEPELVTALRYDEPAVAHELAAWCEGTVEAPPQPGLTPTIWVPTKRGPRPASVGDWIVRRGWGDCYPCTAADFTAMHEPLQ